MHSPEEETLPTPLSMVTDVALETDHRRTEKASVVILEGLAVKPLMTGYAIGGGVGDGAKNVNPRSLLADTSGYAVGGGVWRSIRVNPRGVTPDTTGYAVGGGVGARITTLNVLVSSLLISNEGS